MRRNATIGALVAQHGLGSGKAKSGQPDRVLLAGSMAGGRGAMFSIDSIQGMLAVAGVAKYAVTVQGLFDAALLIPQAPLYTRITSLEEQTQRAIGLFNSSSLYGKTCQYVNSQPTMQWTCLFRTSSMRKRCSARAWLTRAPPQICSLHAAEVHPDGVPAVGAAVRQVAAQIRRASLMAVVFPNTLAY